MTRLEAIHSFRFLSSVQEPDAEFIPFKAPDRAVFYQKFAEQGIVLPDYNRFKRKFLRRRDMMTLMSPLNVRFAYKDREYSFTANEGACWDGASVPTMFVCCNVSKFNHYVILASLLHDAFFALHLMPFEDANNIFSAVLRYHDLGNLALLRYMMGVRSPIAHKLYRKSDVSGHWLNGFIDFHTLV